MEFGGNGPVVAADIASALRIRRISVPVASGVFSGFGLLRSDVEQEFVQPVLADATRFSTGELHHLKLSLQDRAFETLVASSYDILQAVNRFSADQR